MSKRSSNLLLLDMKKAAEKILKYTKGLSFEDFLTDDKTIDAVVRNFEIIGEASLRIDEDFRLENPQDYQHWYEHSHQAIDLQKKAVYGLSEINRHKIKNAQIIACPGCYPTSALLPLIPLLKNQLISTQNIIIDSKSS